MARFTEDRGETLRRAMENACRAAGIDPDTFMRSPEDIEHMREQAKRAERAARDYVIVTLDRSEYRWLS